MITFILGGARSGKSTYAENLARRAPAVTYLATANARDAEMDERIRMHKTRRPAAWTTWEGELAALPDIVESTGGTLLLDCLTMYLSRLFFASPNGESGLEAAWFDDERQILLEVELLFAKHAAAHRGDESAHLIAVSNEVGFGLVPPNLMGRRFRDMQGRANQIAARHADNVALVAAGLPLWLKGTGCAC